MRKPSRTYLLIEERLGTPLLDHVTALRENESASWPEVAFDLGKRTEVLVSVATLRLWFPQLAGERKKAAIQAS